MPLLRYFLYVGGALLALLFVADILLPTQPLPGFLSVADADRPAVRIHSERKWPERIVFDTSAPAAKPSVMAEAGPAETRPAQVAGLAAKPLVREAFAMAPVAGSESRNEAKTASKPAPVVAKVSETKPKRKVAKPRPPHPMVLVAQQPHFGWFDSTW